MSEKDDKSGKHPGGVRHDSRGNAVWQWAVDSGKHAIDSTSRLLKRLEVPGLKLEGDTSEHKQPGAGGKTAGGGAPAKPNKNAGYNPYGGSGGTPGARTGSGDAARAGRPAAARPAAAKPAAAMKPAAGTPSRPSLWQRLFRKR
jgi:hypothetical protein